VVLSFTNRSNSLFPYAAQIKEAVLSGVALEDEQRKKFNQIEQVSFAFVTAMPLE
jgi:Zn-dependent oligopeptidase